MTIDDSQASDVDSAAKSGKRSTWIRLAKAIIAVVVAIGLVMATRSAMTQWRSETMKLQATIRQLDDDLGNTANAFEQAAIRSRMRDLEASLPKWSNLRWNLIGLAALLYGVGLIPPAFLLRRALISLGEHPRISTSIAAQVVGHVGKYVPGKAMVVILRAGALKRDNVRSVPAMVSVFMETLLMMAVGAAVAGIVICWLPVPTWMIVTAIVVAITASLPTLPPILKRVAARVTKTDTIEQTGSGRLFVIGWICSLASWGLIGAAFTLLVLAIPSATELPDIGRLYAIATAAISLAMVVGFASLLPGGAGVRELVLTTVLASLSIGTAHALLAAIAARFVFIVVESLMAAVCWMWLRRE